MWDAIQSNRRRSNLLIGIMGVILIGLGFIFGMVFHPEYGGYLGILAAVLVWAFLCVLAIYQGDNLLLLSAGAHPIERADAPRLWNVVEEMTVAAGLPRMPKVYLIDSDVPNAFAAGRNPESAVVAVTSGLLKMLNRDELQGVIAHEVGHIYNQDVKFMTNAAVLVGAIVLLSDAFLKGMWYSAARRRIPTKGGPQAQIAIVIVAVIAAILAPICAQLLYFACSRKREYLADASAARFTRFPDGLASALGKISGKAGRMQDVSKAVAPLYIINPLQAASRSSGLVSTHPPTEKRIKILRNMGGRAGFVDYESAYRKVNGQGERCLGLRALTGERSVAARAPAAEKETKKDTIERVREVVDMVDRLADFLLISCMCGVRIKLPPEYKRPTIGCPRCGENHPVPHAETCGTDNGDQAKKAPEQEAERPDDQRPKGAPCEVDPDANMEYRRKGKGWESFRCACSRAVQVSPSLQAKFVKCRNCGRKIDILEPEPEPAAAETPQG